MGERKQIGKLKAQAQRATKPLQKQFIVGKSVKKEYLIIAQFTEDRPLLKLTKWPLVEMQKNIDEGQELN